LKQAIAPMKALVMLFFALLLSVSYRVAALGLGGGGLTFGRVEVAEARTLSEADLRGFSNHPSDWNIDQPGNRVFVGQPPQFRLKLTKTQFQEVLGTAQTWDERTFFRHAYNRNHSLTNGLRPGNCGSGFCILTNGEYLVWKLFTPDVLLVKSDRGRKWQMYQVPFQATAVPFQETGTGGTTVLNLNPDAPFLKADMDFWKSPSAPKVRSLLRNTPHQVVRKDELGHFLPSTGCVIMLSNDQAGAFSTGVLMDKEGSPCVWQLIQYPPVEDGGISLTQDRLIVESGNGEAFLYQ
jgi:hypothetical protein